MAPSKRLAGKTVLVTGGSTGIGLGSAAAAVDAGAAAVLVTGTSAARLASAKATLEARAAAAGAGCKVATCVADAASKADAERAAAECAAMTPGGEIHGVFINAGIPGAFVPLTAASEEMIDKVYSINVKGVIWAAQACVPRMPRGGSIVVNSSIAALSGGAGAGIYGSSKAAARSIVKSLACELSAQGIRVNDVAPGAVVTPIYTKIDNMDASTGEAWANTIVKYTPAGRVGTPEDIGACVVFLLSDDASFVNASQLVADGGLMGARGVVAEEHPAAPAPAE